MKTLIHFFLILFSLTSLAQNLPPVVVRGANDLWKFGLKADKRFLIFNYDENRMYLMTFDEGKTLTVLKDYITSGGRGGVSNVIGSGGTGPGVHAIYRKQGADFAIGQTFDASKYGYREMIIKPTQSLEFWKSDFVMTRIMRLRGLEGAKNNNSDRRSILIHGTPSEGLLGYHESQGCIRMTNFEIAELFDLINEGTLVNVVYETGQRKRVPEKMKIYLDEPKYIKETSREIRKPAAPGRGPASEVKLIGGGDVLFHGNLMKQAMVDGHGFESFFEDVKPLLQQADVKYANLEGPVAYQVNLSGQLDVTKGTTFVPSENIYSSMDENFLSFNFHPKAVDALVNLGISIVSTANNHTFDRKFLGIDKTVEELNRARLDNFGSKSSHDLGASWSAIQNINGIRIGYVGCTYGIQGAGPNDSVKAFLQIMFCFQGAEPNREVIKEISRLKSEVDVVILTPHWGTEYAAQANPAQKKLAAAAVMAGARVILGSHPHVIQPYEVIRDADGIKAVVAYSLGNFVTNQMPTDWKNQEKQIFQFPTRASALIALSIKKEADDIKISEPLWIPLYMPPKHMLGDGTRRKLVLGYPEIHNGDLLKKQIGDARRIVQGRLGPEARILTLPQTKNIFENISW